MGYHGLDTEGKPDETPSHEAESAGPSWHGFAALVQVDKKHVDVLIIAANYIYLVLTCFVSAC